MVIFIHISEISDVEHIFMYLLTICTSLFLCKKNVYLGILPFSLKLLSSSSLLFSCVLYYKYQSLIGYAVYKYSPLFPRLTFHFVDSPFAM